MTQLRNSMSSGSSSSGSRFHVTCHKLKAQCCCCVANLSIIHDSLRCSRIAGYRAFVIDDVCFYAVWLRVCRASEYFTWNWVKDCKSNTSAPVHVNRCSIYSCNPILDKEFKFFCYDFRLFFFSNVQIIVFSKYVAGFLFSSFFKQCFKHKKIMK